MRTRTVGHLRDVRRLVVAMSRARLGLYVFARTSLFANCFELTPAFNIVRRGLIPFCFDLLDIKIVSCTLQLTQRPAQLQIHPTEKYPCTRLTNQKHSEEPIVIKDMPELAKLVYEMYMKELDIIRVEEAAKVKVSCLK